MKKITTNTGSVFAGTTKLMAMLLVLMTFLGLQTKAQWTNIATLAPNNNYGVIMLLSDGRAFCKSDGGATAQGQTCGNIWDILTPDIHGSYVNGTWSSSAPMITQRYSFSSQMLMDGRLYAGGGEYGNDGTQNGYHAEVYNPVTNTWAACLGVQAANVISDGNVQILPDGRLLQALVNQPYPTATVIYNPATNNFTAGPSTLGGQNESMWLKLADSSILLVNEGALTSERYIPATNTWIADAAVPVALYDPWGLEAGPAILLPDGRAIFFGSTGNTAYYTPSGNTSPGTWSTGPTMPNGTGMPDAVAVMMQNGIILLACSPSPTSTNEFNSPTYWYTFDYTTSTYTAVNAPTGGASFNGICQQIDMMNLPNGQVLCCINSDNTSRQYYVYTPTGPIVAAGKPIISGISQTSCTEYVLSGQKFNGISEGSAFGDENQNSTNYPIVKLTNGTSVYYCRTHDWNNSGVSTGSFTTTTGFTLPAGIPAGTYGLYVIANGISSDSISITITIPTLSSTLTPPAICSGTAFTYTPTSTTSGATFTWTRAAIAGISNAAITTPQSTNPNEVLVNTTSAPITVIYAYAITGNGCTNTENVSVVVNPHPTASFTVNSTTSCSLPDSAIFTNTSVAGSTYSWSFGDGGTSTALNPTYVYMTGGSYTVKLYTSSACGTDSSIQANYIVINAPVSPTATSPVNVACGGSVTLTATSPDSMKWFNQPTGGTLLGTGGTYITPNLNVSTTYYVQSEVGAGSIYAHPFDSTMNGGGYSNNTTRYEIFTVNQPCTLISVLVYAQTAANRTFRLENSNGVTLDSLTTNVAVGAHRVTLNFPLAVGTNFRLAVTGTTALYRNTAGVAYPYTDASNFVTITSSSAGGTAYYYCYDWELGGSVCVSARTPVSVIINGTNTTITASGPTSFCSNDSVTLTSSSANAYLWSNAATTQAITVNTSGNYIVSATYGSGCTGTAAQQVTVTPQPTASFTYTNVFNAYTFTNTSTNGTSWLWNFGDLGSSTLQNPTHTYATSGTYIVTLYVYNGACVDSTTQTIVLTNTGLNPIAANANLSIYPNPVNDNVVISLATYSATGIWNIKMYDMIGNLLVTDRIIVVSGTNQKNLNLSKLPSGIYTLILENQGNKIIRKVVKR